jgi:hypothetical protein
VPPLGHHAKADKFNVDMTLDQADAGQFDAVICRGMTKLFSELRRTKTAA